MNKKALYNSIMESIAKQVNNTLNEEMHGYNELQTCIDYHAADDVDIICIGYPEGHEDGDKDIIFYCLDDNFFAPGVYRQILKGLMTSQTTEVNGDLFIRVCSALRVKLYYNN